MTGKFSQVHWEIENIWKILKCSNCSKIIKDCIYLCEKGHSFCCKCRKGTRCFLCTEFLTSEVKCYEQINELLKCLPMPCPLKEIGCPTIIRNSNMKYHIEECSYAHFDCPVTNCGEKLFKDRFLNHMCELHNSMVTTKSIGQERECKFSIIAESDYHFCVWHIEEWGVFSYKRVHKNYETSHAVQFVGTTEEASKFIYIVSEQRETAAITFSGAVEPIAFDENVMKRRGNFLVVYGNCYSVRNVTQQIIITICRKDGGKEVKPLPNTPDQHLSSPD